jgi:hypothetical protein
MALQDYLSDFDRVTYLSDFDRVTYLTVLRYKLPSVQFSRLQHLDALPVV